MRSVCVRQPDRPVVRGALDIATMAWCYFLVLSAICAVAGGQIVFGGSPGRGPSSPGRGPSSPGRGPSSPGRGPGSPGRGPGSPGRGPGASSGTADPSSRGRRSCSSPEGRPGVCGRPASCPAVLRRIRQKDADYIRRAFCGRSGGQILLCCADSNQISSGPASSPAPISTSLPGRGRPNPPLSNRPQPSQPNPPRPVSQAPAVSSAPSCPRFRSPSDCGRSPFSPSRVVNGLPVRALGDFPWMAALRYSAQPRFKCGGAVISDRWVITAAHCILSDGPADVVLGDLNLVTDTDDSGSYPPQTIGVQLTIKHPGFRRVVRGSSKGLFNDIALIKLAQRIQFSVVVRPLCIDDSAGSVSALEGAETVIAGWGATEFGELGSSVMQWARVRVTSQQSCRSTYARQGNRVDDTQLCARGQNDRGSVDTCQGDSGGPLMIQRTRNNLDLWYIAGIVSYGTGCGSPESPGVYSFIGAHLDWIGCTVNNN